MSEQRPQSPGRYRAGLILGLILAIVCVVIGVVVLALNANPLFGWFFLAVGVVVSVVAGLQLRRTRRS